MHEAFQHRYVRSFTVDVDVASCSNCTRYYRQSLWLVFDFFNAQFRLPSFDVSVTPQAGRPNNGKIITFANGSQNLSGAVFVTVTNLSNFKSINLNIGGPGRVSVVDNTFTSYGAGLDVFASNLVPANLPPVAFTHG